MCVVVTVGVCTKNSEKTIRQSVESIVAQKYPAELIQLIVVDGCSKDNTLSIIKSIVSTASVKTEIYSDGGKGLGTARQIVFKNAQGKYVIFVDSDVILFDDFIGNHVDYMEENPDIAVASGMPVLKEGLLQEKTLIARLYDLVKCSADRTGAVACEATIYRFEDLRRVGGFDEKIKGAAEDRDLIARIRLEGLKISTNKKARFFHKQRENVRSIWDELSWTGYGDHYYVHKHGNVALWRKFPAAEFIYFLKLTSGAYRQTRVRLSFIFLLPLIFGNIAWWAGFTRGHLNGYGHAP